MKKALLVLFITSIALVGCKTEPKTYGVINDYSLTDTEDYHVIFAMGKDGFYSDGSWEANGMMDWWIKDYERNH